jgi:cyclophilin family peptidyl-prolyl cis-trans isomerase
VDNFLRYASDGFYTNTLFHRVIGGFVAQGGWLVPATGSGGELLGTAVANPKEKPGARPAIALESNKGLANLRGTIAMARTDEPDSAKSQFYFNLVDNSALNFASTSKPGYAVFGRVIQGLPVMDAMSIPKASLVTALIRANRPANAGSMDSSDSRVERLQGFLSGLSSP